MALFKKRPAEEPGPNIDGLRAAGDVAALIQALGHVKPGVRAEAARALGRLGDASALVSLVVFLTPHAPNFAADAAARTAVKEALPRLASVDRLLEIVRTGPALARSGAVTSLGVLGDLRAVEPLIGLLEGSPAAGDETTDILFALGQLGDPRAAEAVVGRVVERLRAFDLKGFRLTPEMADMLLDRAFTVEVASVVPYGPAAVGSLRAALEGEADRDRRFLIEAVLGRVERDGPVALVTVWVPDEQTAQRIVSDGTFMIETLTQEGTADARDFLTAIAGGEIGTNISGKLRPNSVRGGHDVTISFKAQAS